MSETRKLAAILVADVVGYSRLTGAEEERTLARLRTLRSDLLDPAISVHHGRVVKRTGDGAIVEFRSVVDALRCAVEVQEGMTERNSGLPQERRLEFRIGVHLGDVVEEGDGDLMGDGVNIAARLQSVAKPSGICLSEDAYRQVKARVDLAVNDLGLMQLKNIAEPMRVFAIDAGADALSKSGLRAGTTPADPAPSALAWPDKPSVAVLPFSNMSNDPEQEFIADGVADDVITALSRYPSLFVIARNSSFTYKGRTVDVKQVGRELGVRYVLEGSLRRSDDRVRITAQLVEAENGRHVWAERYDRVLTDIFALQDEIADAVTTAIAPAIADAERQRAMRRAPSRLDAWGAYQRGLWHLAKATAEDNTRAQQCFHDAISLDPKFANGYIGAAVTLWQDAIFFFRSPFIDALRSALDMARRAVELDDGNADAHASLSVGLTHVGDSEGALIEAERALALSPNLANAHRALGTALIYSGRPKEGLKAMAIAARLDPRSPIWAWEMDRVAVGHYFASEYEAAVAEARRVIRARPDFPHVYRWLAAALGQLGRATEAEQALERLRAIAPASLDLVVRNRAPYHRPEDYEHMLEGLRKAGWTE